MVISELINKRGISLIIGIAITAIVVFIILAIMPQAVNELQMAQRMADSTRAFYAADSGINNALWALNNCVVADDWVSAGWNIGNPDLYVLPLQQLNDASNRTIAYYQVSISNPVTETPTANSVGFAPDQNGADRSIRASLKRKIITPNPGLITAAVEAEGEISIGGDAEVVGDVKEESEFIFEDIFGLTKEDLKRLVDVIRDPPNNYQPVSGTTWFEQVNNSIVRITANGWLGNGIMIVENGDLKITGGHFKGLIWVMGNLDIAGNAGIHGAIFVEGDVKITGTPYIEYDPDAINDAFNNALPPMPFEIDRWKEL